MEGKREDDMSKLLMQSHPSDLVKFGLIPEFVGRIPIITSLTELTEEDLIRILTEPKNALVKQYMKLFDLDKVRLRFTTNALAAIARKAIERKTGARGLRNVMENIMLEIMYQLPSLTGVTECVINKAVVDKGAGTAALLPAGSEDGVSCCLIESDLKPPSGDGRGFSAVCPLNS